MSDTRFSKRKLLPFFRWIGHKFLMYLNKELDIFLPQQYWYLYQYRQTLGHKLNHSFKYNNVKFGHAYHPRFGKCRAIIALKNIPRNQELLVDYGYEKGSLVPEWYVALYKKELGLEWYAVPQRSIRKNQPQNQPFKNVAKRHSQNQFRCGN